MKGMKEYPSEYAEMLYYTASDAEKRIGIWPYNCGRMTAKPNYQSGPRMTRYYSVHFVTEGRVIYTFDGQQVCLQKGDLFALFPFTPVQYNVDPSNPKLQMSWVSIQGDGALALFEYAGLRKESPYLLQPYLPGLPSMLNQILHEFRRLHTGENYLHCLSMVFELFSLLAASNMPKMQKKKSPSVWLQESMHFMNEHFAEGITVQDVANQSGVNRSYFSVEFSKCFGISPMRYLQKLKLENGAKMLNETNLSVTEIAMSLGYPELYAFTRAFREYYGMSPREYRKKAVSRIAAEAISPPAREARDRDFAAARGGSDPLSGADAARC
jgi:AraC-like DNA-binding protein